MWGNDHQTIPDNPDIFRYMRGSGLCSVGKLADDYLLAGGKRVDVCRDLLTLNKGLQPLVLNKIERSSMMEIFKFELNQIVKDKITGFQGVILGRTEYATGCVQYGICPQKLKSDGAYPDWVWLDGSRLIATQDKVEIEPENGGPHPLAPSMQ